MLVEEDEVGVFVNEVTVWLNSPAGTKSIK